MLVKHFHDVEAMQAGHDPVGEHHVDGRIRALDQPKPGLGVLGLDDLTDVRLEHPLDEPADRGLVVDDEHGGA